MIQDFIEIRLKDFCNVKFLGLNVELGWGHLDFETIRRVYENFNYEVKLGFLPREFIRPLTERIKEGDFLTTESHKE